MGKRQILLDSVQKLLSMNISDDEIVNNLKDVGATEQEVRDLIAEAKGEKKDAGEKDTESEKTLTSVYSSLEKETKETPIDSKKGSNLDMSDLWQKGILATVDSKLDEMEKSLKEIKKTKVELDTILEEKVAAALEKETKKRDVIMESQRTLLTAKVDTALEEKKEEISSVIESKLEEIKRISELTQQNLDRIQESKKSTEKTLEIVETKLNELGDLKKDLTDELNQSIEQSDKKLKDFVKSANEKIAESDSRINRALELETKITEGLLKDSEKKIEEVTSVKTKEFSDKLTEMKTEFSVIKDELVKQMKEVEKRLNELELFKSQFIKVVEKNVETFNKAKKEVTELMGEREKKFTDQVSEMDKKISELDKILKSVGTMTDSSSKK